MHLTPELLLKAYAIGIFPMAESRHDPDLHWIDPEERGILPLDRLHVPRRLKKTIRSGCFEVSCDLDFPGVVTACAAPRDGRPDTWINPAIQRLVEELFEMGFAHSVECRHDGRLVGGLYGIALGASFFGESMFSLETDASKVALVALVARLKKGGFLLLDTQFTTTHLARFGVIEVSRSDYRQRLAAAIPRAASFESGPVTKEELSEFLKETI